jgi:TnpA family transposase
MHDPALGFPGRALSGLLGPNETPPAHLLAFIAEQLQINLKAFGDYAQRDETRREHLAELEAYLDPTFSTQRKNALFFGINRPPRRLNKGTVSPKCL